MKKYSCIVAISFFGLAYSQVILGDAKGTAQEKSSVLLEFSQENKGIVLPYVTQSLFPQEGSILLDARDPQNARVKYYNGNIADGNAGWFDLSGKSGMVTSELAQQPTTATEKSDAKVVIGSNTSSADGVLVLESDTRAMVLPIVETVQSIENPAPGMMVFLGKTGSKRLAVYNGTVWSFWKP